MVYRPIPLTIGLPRPLFHLATGWVPSWSMRRHEASEHSFGSRRSSRLWRKCHRKALGKHWQNDQNYGKMMVRCCKMWWIFRWNSHENYFLEWPELAKEPRTQLSSCIFVFISWSGSRSLHPKPRCWKICDFVWIVPCLHKTQLYPNINYDMLCISLYLTISHYIFLTCRSYTPNIHPNSRISGTPEPQSVFSLSVHDEPGWIIWINWNQNRILTGAERREWMGLGVAGIMIYWYCGSFFRKFPTYSTHQSEFN